MIKAFSIHTILGQPAAGQKVEPNRVFEIDKTEFTRLEKMGAVRRPTDEELALAEANGGLVIDEAPVPVAGSEIPAGNTVVNASATPPDSGDDGDPKSKPKGATKKAAAEKVEADKVAAEKAAAEAKASNSSDDDI